MEFEDNSELETGTSILLLYCSLHFLMPKWMNCVEKSVTDPPHCTCQSTRPLEMLPLPWRQMYPCSRLSEKIFTLSPFTGFIYSVREPEEAHAVILCYLWVNNAMCVLACAGVSPGSSPPIWYQKWTHSVLVVPRRTGDVRSVVSPKGRMSPAVLAIM